MPEGTESKSGTVYVVGAGPGDAGLITLRGVDCLRRADFVLYDYLVNPQILEHAPPTAERLCLGRHGMDRLMTQAEINERLVREATAGKTVVRLKGGDPAVFAHLAEEIDCLVAAGIAFEIVPGITAALAAASYAGIPLTHRDRASAVALVTGHEQDAKEIPALDYAALAAFPGTLVMYMGVTNADVWTSALLASGKPGSTPVAIVRRCSWPDQLVVRCMLSEVPSEIRVRKLRPPAMVIVGDVASLEPAASWFMARPLFGTRILVTRPAGQADSLRDRLQELGALVLVQPAIQIRPPADWAAIDSALARMGEYDWVVFSSANGVRGLLDRIWQQGGDTRTLAGARLAAIGPGTADELARYHLRPDVVPAEFRAEALAAELAQHAPGRRLLLVRASRGREVLSEQLQAAGAHVDQVVVYESTDVQAPDPEIQRLLAEGKIDWVTVTSSAIARSLVSLFGDELKRSKLASLSPVTSDTLRQLGYPPEAEATLYTMPGLADAIVRRST